MQRFTFKAAQYGYDKVNTLELEKGIVGLLTECRNIEVNSNSAMCTAYGSVIEGVLTFESDVIFTEDSLFSLIEKHMPNVLLHTVKTVEELTRLKVILSDDRPTLWAGLV